LRPAFGEHRLAEGRSQVGRRTSDAQVCARYRVVRPRPLIAEYIFGNIALDAIAALLGFVWVNSSWTVLARERVERPHIG